MLSTNILYLCKYDVSDTDKLIQQESGKIANINIGLQYNNDKTDKLNWILSSEFILFTVLFSTIDHKY